MAERPFGDGNEVKRLYTGVTDKAEGPSLRVSTATTVMGRIGDLAKQATEAAHMLAEARDQYQRAAEGRQKAAAAFAAVSEALTQAIQEHREGTPENVPYRP